LAAGVTGTSLTVDCGYLAAAEWEMPGQTAFGKENLDSIAF